MPVRADLRVRPFDVVEDQNLIGIFVFIRLQRHKRMIHKEKNFGRKKILKIWAKIVRAVHIYIYMGGVGGGPPLGAFACWQRSDQVMRHVNDH